MYGAAEATARMGYLPPEDAIRKTGAMGIAIPGGRFSLVDEDGAEIETADTVGELVYYGANVTLGYAMCGADLARGDERNGRYETGDLARRDEDGYYSIVGRKRRFLKLRRSRAYPTTTVRRNRCRLHRSRRSPLHLCDTGRTCSRDRSFFKRKTRISSFGFYGEMDREYPEKQLWKDDLHRIGAVL